MRNSGTTTDKRRRKRILIPHQQAKKTIVYCLLFICAVTIHSSCSQAENEFSTYPCRVVINNGIHQDPTLASALNANAPGIFCIIRQIMDKGVMYLHFQNNQNAETRQIINAQEMQMRMICGLNNGVIVGYGNLEFPAKLFAYDLQCPNCFSPTAFPLKNRSLSINSNGIGKCNTCHREYNLNTGGNIIKGNDGNKLTRYRIISTGPFNFLRIEN